MSDHPLLEFRRVGWVDGRQRLVDDLSFSLARGSWLAIQAQGVATRSGLARLALGLVAPHDGQVRIFGRDLSSATPREAKSIRTRIGSVVRGGALVADLSIRDNIAFPLRLGQAARHAARDTGAASKVDYVMVTFGLNGWAHAMPRQVPVEVVRRAAIARAFVAEPDLLILDSVLDDLDEDTRQDILAVLRRLRRKPNRPAALITGALAERLCAIGQDSPDGPTDPAFSLTRLIDGQTVDSSLPNQGVST